MVTKQQVIGIELEGTIAARVKGTGWDFHAEDWVFNPDCLKGLKALHENDCYILIHTVYINPEVDISRQVTEITKFMKKHGAPFNSIHVEVGKPRMDFEVDIRDDIMEYLRDGHKW